MQLSCSKKRPTQLSNCLYPTPILNYPAWIKLWLQIFVSIWTNDHAHGLFSLVIMKHTQIFIIPVWIRVIHRRDKLLLGCMCMCVCVCVCVCVCIVLTWYGCLHMFGYCSRIRMWTEIEQAKSRSYSYEWCHDPSQKGKSMTPVFSTICQLSFNPFIRLWSSSGSSICPRSHFLQTRSSSQVLGWKWEFGRQ